MEHIGRAHEGYQIAKAPQPLSLPSDFHVGIHRRYELNIQNYLIASQALNSVQPLNWTDRINSVIVPKSQKILQYDSSPQVHANIAR